MPSKLLSKIAPVRERPPNTKSVIFGPPGSGKTVFACKAPSPLLLDVENGALSLLNHPELRDTPRLDVKGAEGLEDFVLDARSNPADYEDFQTLIVDTISELQDQGLTDILRSKTDTRQGAGQSIYAAQQFDYKENTEHLRRIFLSLCELGKDVIFLAHVAEIKDDSTGKLYTRPQLSPKLAGTVRGLVDIQGYLTAEYVRAKGDEPAHIRRLLQLVESGTIQAKTRVGGLPPIIEDPTYDMILNAHRNNLEAE